MMLARLGRARVAVLIKQTPGRFERPSDIEGLIYIPFKEHVQDAAATLAKEMHSQGIELQIARL